VPTTPATPRLAEDRCPGVLRLIEAADGLLARVRLPGGLLGVGALAALAAATDAVGDGRLELTSRGNVQVRGMTADGADELARLVTTAGLLPTPARDRVRNVLASPLAGIDSGADLTDLVRELDARLQAERGLGELSGRFLLGLDDGRGDIAALAPDLLAVVRDDGAWVEGAACAVTDVVPLLVDAARAFLAARVAVAPEAWRMADHPALRAAVRERLGGADVELPPPPTPPLGRVTRSDGGAALVAAAPLGRLTSEQARWLAGHATGELRVTPWRSVVVPHAPAADPGEVGLVTDPTSPWRTVTACAGRPRCGSALADVQADAAAALGRFTGRRVHWAGCDRCCGRTTDVEVTMIATTEGYRIA